MSTIVQITATQNDFDFVAVHVALLAIAVSINFEGRLQGVVAGGVATLSTLGSAHVAYEGLGVYQYVAISMIFDGYFRNITTERPHFSNYIPHR